MLFFSCDCRSLQQWSFSQLSKENIPQHDRADFPKAPHPFSFPQPKPLPLVISQLTDRAASHLENLGLLSRTTWGLLPISMFASRYYSLPSQASTHQGLPLPFNLLFQRYLPRQKPAYQHWSSPSGLFSQGSVNCWKHHGEKGWHSPVEQAAFLLPARITAAVISVDGNIICLHFLGTKIGHNTVAPQVRTLGLRIPLSVCVVPGTVGACPSL